LELEEVFNQIYNMQKSKKGQVSLADAPQIVLIVGLVFLIMATVALVSEKYGDSLVTNTAGCNATDTTLCSVAYNVTNDLNTEIANNTSIAGIVLTISLVGIVLSVLIGVFVGMKKTI